MRSPPQPNPVRIHDGPPTRKRFGLVADEEQRALSGIEFVQGLADGSLPLNSMAQTLGYDIVDVAKGRVVTAVEPHAGHLNPSGTVHGGVAATLLDSAMGCAVFSILPADVTFTTSNLSVNYFRQATVETGTILAIVIGHSVAKSVLDEEAALGHSLCRDAGLAGVRIADDFRQPLG